MVIKEKFVLLKDVPNVLKLSNSVINAHSKEEDILNLVRVLRLVEHRIRHFTSKRVYEIASNISTTKKLIHVINFPQYTLPVSYNSPTKKIVININPFGVDEISKLDPKVIYASVVYGICFSDLVTGKTRVKDLYFPPITQFLTTVFVRIFGKEYGLLGAYATELPKLKFLLGCYILDSFFGVKKDAAYKKASVVSSYPYKADIDQLNKYDFSDIGDFITSLSEMKVMPGLSKYNFTAKFLRFLTINFLPALEDCSRFISSMLVANIPGSPIIPSFIYTYNVTEYNKILTITKTIFR